MRSTKRERRAKVAVIGGGVAGSSIALYLGRRGVDVTLFEKKKSLVDGPPMCHLHAGGNLYREISDAQCLTLLHESIELLRFYPFAIDYRPTVIAVPTDDKGDPSDLYPRLKMLQESYQKLIDQDPKNAVLGSHDDYYRCYSEAEIRALRAAPDTILHPQTADEWMTGVAKSIDLSKVKFPLILVQEYGLNMFRIAATATLALKALKNVQLMMQSSVSHILPTDAGWKLRYQEEGRSDEATFDYLINAAGFRSGMIDDMINSRRQRHVEFKSAYVTEWKEHPQTLPEIVFFGERGTPKGMAQFTPYPDGYFQLHGMTKEITLFDDGLVQSTTESAQPQLDQKYLDKIDKAWEKEDALRRSQSAIDYLSRYIPAFKSARVASRPLYGAQQIPGDDETLRAADVSFEGVRYARCEIVKASSVLTMADAITQKLMGLGYLSQEAYGKRDYEVMSKMDEKEIAVLAEQFTQERGYPGSLAHRVKTRGN